MSLAKLLSLLKEKALFFARADRLGDPFEGAKGLVRRKEIWDAHYLAFFEDSFRHPPPGYECQLNDVEVAAEAQRLLQQLESGGLSARKTTFLSCWHEAPHESEALWRIYGGDTGQAIVIRTTFQNLRDALDDDPYIAIGRVQYVELERTFAGINSAFFRKRSAFKHEQEVRAVIRHYENPPDGGMYRRVDVNKLIMQIYVSPLAPHWFQDVVKEAALLFGCAADVSRSHLAEEPFY